MYAEAYTIFCLLPKFFDKPVLNGVFIALFRQKMFESIIVIKHVKSLTDCHGLKLVAENVSLFSREDSISHCCLFLHNRKYLVNNGRRRISPPPFLAQSMISMSQGSMSSPYSLL